MGGGDDAANKVYSHTRPFTDLGLPGNYLEGDTSIAIVITFFSSLLDRKADGLFLLYPI